MKKLRAASVIVFIASLALLGVSALMGKAGNSAGPEIRMDSELIEVSAADGDEALKSGVTVTDAAGNDLTDTLEVESIGPFDESGHRVVTYVAFDAGNRLARAQRQVAYTDYTSPRFNFDRPLSFPVDSSSLLSGVTVTDSIDGVQDNNIWIRYDGIIDTSMPGEYPVVLETTNSAGDTASLPVTIEIYDDSIRAGLPIIRLREYVVYLEEGAAWDPLQYVDSVMIGGLEYAVSGSGTGAADGTEAAADTDAATGTEAAAAQTGAAVIDPARIGVSGSVDTGVPGNYEVVYTCEDIENGTGTGSVRLYVVVTERRNAGK